MELIILIIVIMLAIHSNRMKQQKQKSEESKKRANSVFSGQQTPASQPARSNQSNKPNPAGQPHPGISDIQREVMTLNKKVSSTDDPVSRLSLYEKVLLRDHYSTISSVSKELHLPPSRVISDIKELQANGYFKDVCIDRSGINITYHHDPNHAISPRTGAASVSTRIHAKGKMGQNTDYLDTIPNGYHVVKCSYCGAENAVPVGAGDFHCYFCWEQL